jgi:predicted acylesterase/phospholipase RssA
MSGDLFSYTNTGEPKHIVNEFIDEVSTCARWLTDECNRLSHNNRTPKSQEESTRLAYDCMLQKTVIEEKKMLWQSVLATSIQMAGLASNVIERHDLPPTPKELMSDFHRQEVLAFLKRARASYGRTALCLSGGAMMGTFAVIASLSCSTHLVMNYLGLYHFGHARALIEAGVLPNIISGTSGGSVVGAILCTRTDEELLRDLNPNELIKHITCFDRPWGERLKSLWKTGSLFSFEAWMEKIQWFSKGLTFLEAYKKTGRVFCVTLSSTTLKAPSVLLNHVTAPNVTIASAVVASAAVPGFVPPCSLQYKAADGSLHFHDGETYWDGSIERDIPVDGLAEMFNCGYFVVCQTNPHVVPFFYNCKGAVGRPSRWSSGMQEDSWRGGFVLAALEMYLKNDMKAKMRFLRDVEAGVSFTSSMMVQEFEGSTTIVPQVRFVDYFRLFSDPKLEEIYHYYQNGSVAAYEHLAVIKLHYKLADLMDECIDALEKERTKRKPVRRTKMNIPIDEMRVNGLVSVAKTTSADSDDSARNSPSTVTSDENIQSSDDEDEYERSWNRPDPH